MRTFTVIFQTGGTDNFRWDRVAERYVDAVEAIRKAQELEKQGYRALVHDTDRLDAIGLPDSYEV